MKTVAYIHGFNSSSRSFSYLLKNLQIHNVILVNYESHQKLQDSLDQVFRQLPKGEIALLGHSLGGLIATLLAIDEPQRITDLVTISAPLAGSKAANALRWLPGSPALLEGITQTSPFIRKVSTAKLSIPTLSIFSTSGHLKALGETNDSIVSVASQKALKFGKKAEVKANHFEVLLHDRTTDLIQKHLFGDRS